MPSVQGSLNSETTPNICADPSNPQQVGHSTEEVDRSDPLSSDPCLYKRRKRLKTWLTFILTCLMQYSNTWQLALQLSWTVLTTQVKKDAVKQFELKAWEQSEVLKKSVSQDFHLSFFCVLKHKLSNCYLLNTERTELRWLDMTWVKWETIHNTVDIYLDNKRFESMSSGMGGSTVKYSKQDRLCKRSVTWVEHWTSKVWVISGKNIRTLIYKTPILKEYSSFFRFFFFFSKNILLLLLLNYMCTPL